MPCYHPLKAFDISSVDGLSKNNKKNLIIKSYNVNHLEKIKDKYIECYDDYRSDMCERYIKDYIEIPCGKCIGCRLEYSRQWANRMMLEAKYHSQNWFVTLTYDDLHLPRSYYGDPNSGEPLPSLTLRKRDIQLFFKRLRKQTGQQFRYYCCGEYGENTHRPHYHFIIFGLELNDLVFLKRSDNFNYYTSETISNAWSEYDNYTGERTSFGFHMVCEVSWETCAYVARYVTKKLNGTASEFYDTFNIQPEFCVMSRKPGIGRQYFDDNAADILKYQNIIISTPNGGKEFKPPRYYDKLFDIIVPDEMAEIREIRRRTAENATRMKLERTNLSYIELLEVAEQNKIAQTKSLIRSDI